MQCPKCGHNVPSSRDRCMYCGALVADQIPLDAEDASETGKDNVFVEKTGKGSGAVNLHVEQRVYQKLEDMPESLRQKAEEALREGGEKAFSEEKTVSYTFPGSKTSQVHGTLSLREVLNILAEIRKRFSNGEIDYATYRQIVIDIMKDYINPFDDQTKLDYILHEIKDSPVAIYFDEDMYKELQGYVISIVSGTHRAE